MRAKPKSNDVLGDLGGEIAIRRRHEPHVDGDRWQFGGKTSKFLESTCGDPPASAYR